MFPFSVLSSFIFSSFILSLLPLFFLSVVCSLVRSFTGSFSIRSRFHHPPLSPSFRLLTISSPPLSLSSSISLSLSLSLLSQTSMQKHIMGTSWWNRKKIDMGNLKEDENNKHEKARKAEEKRLIRLRSWEIRNSMGSGSYFKSNFVSKRSRLARNREYLERMHPYPVVTIGTNKKILVVVPPPVNRKGDQDLLEELEKARNRTLGL